MDDKAFKSLIRYPYWAPPAISGHRSERDRRDVPAGNNAPRKREWPTDGQSSTVPPLRFFNGHPGPSLTPSILEGIPTHHAPLTQAEKTSLWNYIHFAPTGSYGTTGSGPFCAFRDIAFPSCQIYPQAHQWMLIAAEKSAAIRNGIPEPQSLLRRKAESYKAIGRLLKDESTRYTDETLVLIIAAIVLESRFRDVEVTRMHMRGLQTLIQQRGGLAALFHSSAVMYHPILFLGHLTHVPLAILRQEELDMCKTSFIKSLVDMKTWNRRLCTLVGREMGANCQVLDPVDITILQTQPTTSLQLYIETRRRTFTSLVVKPYISLPPIAEVETYFNRTSRFTILYLLNLILWNYSRSYTTPSTKHSVSAPFLEAAHFLTIFSHYALNSGETNPVTGSSSIRPGTMVWVIAKTWVDTDPVHSLSAQRREEELCLAEMGMNAIKVFGNLEEEKLREVMEVLSGWLLETFDGCSASDTGPGKTGDFGFLL